jgi:hypothetical protein
MHEIAPSREALAAQVEDLVADDGTKLAAVPEGLLSAARLALEYLRADPPSPDAAALDRAITRLRTWMALIVNA